jgi:hypothetical protein
MRGWLIRLIGLACIVVALVAATITDADAKAVNLTPAVEDYPSEALNPVIYTEPIIGRWYYLELADGSQWAITRCRTDERDQPRSCWWNARKFGNHRGHSFAVIDGTVHHYRRASQP